MRTDGMTLACPQCSGSTAMNSYLGQLYTYCTDGKCNWTSRPDLRAVVTSITVPERTGGIRYNKNKPPYHLISPFALEGVARVLEFGARKYTVYGSCDCGVKEGVVAWDEVDTHTPTCTGLTPVRTGARNWEKGLSWVETVRSTLSHAFALLRGERLDKESKLPHADHLMCNAMFLSHFFHTKTGTDDLP